MIYDSFLHFVSLFQVLSALDILQPPHLDFFNEMYPFYFILLRYVWNNWAGKFFIVSLNSWELNES